MKLSHRLYLVLNQNEICMAADWTDCYLHISNAEGLPELQADGREA
jgi:hypothetical protein